MLMTMLMMAVLAMTMLTMTRVTMIMLTMTMVTVRFGKNLIKEIQDQGGNCSISQRS